MFWLERRYPNEFALRTVIRDTVEAEARAVFDKISLEQLVDNARLAAEIAANPPSGLAATHLVCRRARRAQISLEALSALCLGNCGCKNGVAFRFDTEIGH